ncbi:MAG: hypothetical protein K2X27_07270 [Candidatus Obscuribacterales bacterium]|nr:hypothetical protein [Candidatus Obscuribacterales bacterium]
MFARIFRTRVVLVFSWIFLVLVCALSVFALRPLEALFGEWRAVGFLAILCVLASDLVVWIWTKHEQGLQLRSVKRQLFLRLSRIFSLAAFSVGTWIAWHASAQLQALGVFAAFLLEGAALLALAAIGRSQRV